MTVGREPLAGLATARLWAAVRFPYLASAVFGMRVGVAAGSGAVSVDEQWRLRADPAVTADWVPAELGSVLVHHVYHLLRAHADRARIAGVIPAEAATWVRAADAEINDDLVPAGLQLPGEPVLPQQFGEPEGQLAERYFDVLRVDEAVTGRLTAGPPGHDCGQGADGFGRADADDEDGLSGWEADLLRRQVARDCLRHAREAGDLPAGLARWARELLSPQVDWRKLLAAELRRAVASRMGAVDYTYRRPSRRAAVAAPVVLPALRRPVPEVAVVCDTSGSMTSDLLAMVLAEVEGLLRAAGLSGQLRVLACDTAVAPVQRVSAARQVELTGGGGTDMGAGIAAAAALRPRPAVAVVLTDGHTPWPAQPPRGVRVLIGLLGDGAPDAPAWARSVRIPTAG